MVQAQHDLIVNFIPFAKTLAFELHLSSGFEYYELKSLAYFGLVEAALKYNDNKNDNFAGYAALRIKGKMLDFLRQQASQNRIIKAQRKEKELSCDAN